MGLTNRSVGLGAIDSDFVIQRQAPEERVIALAGNPNVGKSTLFNQLTGLHQHTGNWPGKTVANAQGRCHSARHAYVLVDIPGTYSLMAHSAEETVARDFICFGEPDAVIVVCDATCLVRSLNLVLQILEVTNRVIVCVNLLDEAQRRHIHLNLPLLSQRLGVPVVGTVAHKRKSLSTLLDAMDDVIQQTQRCSYELQYPADIESAIAGIASTLPHDAQTLSDRWLSLRLLEGDATLLHTISKYAPIDFMHQQDLLDTISAEKFRLAEKGINSDQLKDQIVTAITKQAEVLCQGVVTNDSKSNTEPGHRLDWLLTSRITAYPLMLIMLSVIFWLTIFGSNIPSQWLSDGFVWIQNQLLNLCTFARVPIWLTDATVYGVYQTLAWVISVMLPPMAIFFPLFTLLEDAGYLPRVAYNLDRPFQCCHACGKQALCMCIGYIILYFRIANICEFQVPASADRSNMVYELDKIKIKQ